MRLLTLEQLQLMVLGKVIIQNILLLILLAGGLLSAGYLTGYQTPLAEEMDRAGELALLQEMEQASRLAHGVRAQWQQRWKITAVFSDHQPMEQIDSLFAELAVYLQTKEDVHFAACCQNLSTLTRAVGEAHAINWWNLM